MIRPVYAPKTGVGGEEITMRAVHYLKIMDNVETHIQAYTCSEREIGRREKRERGWRRVEERKGDGEIHILEVNN